MNGSTPHNHSVDSQRRVQYYTAYSIGTAAASKIPIHGLVGSVHSIFRRVVNIEVPAKGLVSVVGRTIGRGPLNICAEIPEHVDLTTIGLETGHIAMRVDNLIILGDRVLVISIESAALWEPQHEFEGVLDSLEGIEANLAAMRALALRSGHLSGLAQLLELSEVQSTAKAIARGMNPVARFALPHVLKLSKAIRLGKSQDITDSARHLVGLGHGLTPAGDDFLAGLMLTMSYAAKNLDIEEVRVEEAITCIVSCIRGRTTAISEGFLLQAAAGQANEITLTLIRALLTSEPNDVLRSARAVLDIGGTSGTDTILGILFGFRLLLGSECERDAF